ncbi:hypothetical protein P389DRAFT_197541 [Cystobasidium minutum MCA 4210]|uniref:uncharacterized protein n=1 Tax=Cystobasidium minutum MCA 4210 TaxID=1397322 RepID=UPI0034CF7DBA|eukprot:jgi/Rhomi1/197541/gm1.5755_g
MAAYWNAQQPDLQDDGSQMNGQTLLATSTMDPPPVASTSSAIAAAPAAGGETAVNRTTAAGPLKVACLACRKLKIRCNRGDATSRCVRCERFNLDCRYKEHARGQKRVNNGSAEKESPTGTSPKRQKQPTISRESSPGSSNELDSGSANVLQDVTAISEPPPPSWSLSALLNLRKPAPPPQYADQFPDAISLGILSLPAVEALFEFFFNEMNPFLGIFDRSLHTAEYVRNTSSLLFTAILAVATRHRFREAHTACLQQVHAHLDTILSRDRKRPWLPTIQALCTLAYWKESNDDGGWRRAQNLAILMLHGPNDVVSTRSTGYGEQPLPLIAPESINDAATFVHLTREALAEDWWLAAALEYSNLRYQTRSARVYCMELLERGQTSGADFIRYTARFDSLKADFDRWRHKWLTEGTMFRDAPKSRLMLSFYSAFMAFFISRTRTDVFSAFHEINRDMAYQTNKHFNSLLECYSDATAVLTSLQQISVHKYALIYMADTVPVGACAAAVWLLHAIKQEHLQNRLNEVRDKLSAAASACRAASTHRSDTAKKLARFFESILPRETPVALPPLPVPSYVNGSMGYPPQQMMQPQDPQTLVNYGMQPGAGFTPTSGFDFSNMGTLFDNNLGGNIFDPNLDLESFWSFYQTVDT